MGTRNTLTAPRCRLQYQGRTIARGSNVTVNVAYDVQPVQVIDSLEPVEHAITGYNVGGTIGLIGTRGTTVKSLGWFPSTGKSSDEHLLNVILQEEGVLVLMDKATPAKILKTIKRVTFASHGWQVAAGGLVGIDVEYQGIRESDESEAGT